MAAFAAATWRHSFHRAGSWFSTGVDSASSIPESRTTSFTESRTYTELLPKQTQVRALYTGQVAQSAITITIMANFVASAAKSQLMFEDGLAVNEGTSIETFFWWSEFSFAVIFVVDLLVNLYGHFFRPFFNDAWNIFDCAVIIVTLLSQFNADMPMMSVLRLFRAFRAFRLFKRIPELHAIMAASLRSLPSVSHAFLILGLVMGIWSIMAVEFWTEDDFCTGLGEQLGDYGACMDMFGQFTLSMLSMFQVTTFDSWSSGVTRPMVLSASKAIMQLQISIFFISYQFISAIIMMNVVVAILLDKFLTPDDKAQKAANSVHRKSWDTWAAPDVVVARLNRSILEIEMLVQALARDDKLAAVMQIPIPAEREPCDAAEDLLEVQLRKLKAEYGTASGGLSSVQQLAGMIFDLRATVTAGAVDDAVNLMQRHVRGFLGRTRVRRLRFHNMRTQCSMETDRSSGSPRNFLNSASIGDMEMLAYEWWVQTRLAARLAAFQKWSEERLVLPWQAQVRRAYESQAAQITVAALIFVNFLVSAVKAEMNPLSKDQDTVFLVIEAIFGVLFAFELLVNMYGYFFLAFWMNAWNIFDFGVVTISSLALLYPNLPGVSVLRLFRAFRAFRLFKRMKGLRNIVVGVLRSLPRVSYAFVILILIMGIWSIIAVETFGKDFPDFFGNFFLSMLTLFQVMTYDAWTSQIARPVIVHMKTQSPVMGVVAASFFATYVFAASIFMMNVVIAILIDKFLASAAEEKRKDEQAKRAKQQAEKAGNGGGDSQHTVLLKFDFELQTRLLQLRDRLRGMQLATTGASLPGIQDGQVAAQLTNGKEVH